MDFQNRVAVVTGGTGFLGRSVTLNLLQSGCRVAAPYRSDAEWARLEREAGDLRNHLWGVKLDLASGESVTRFTSQVEERWERIDFLVCIAGGFAAGKMHETSEETWNRMFDLNLKTVFVAVRCVVPGMIKRNFGRVITISSGAILRGGGAGVAAYAISKGAVRHLTEILADELSGYNIHVHSIMPGTMDTEANRHAMPKADFGKWVKTDEVARVIHFLLSDDARAVRSVVVPVLG